MLQPLNLVVFCHVKTEWRKILQDYQLQTRFVNLDKPNFVQLLKKLFNSDKCFTRAHAIWGFERSGHFPLNMERIDKTRLNVSRTFDNSTSTPNTQPSTSRESECTTNVLPASDILS